MIINDKDYLGGNAISLNALKSSRLLERSVIRYLPRHTRVQKYVDITSTPVTTESLNITFLDENGKETNTDSLDNLLSKYDTSDDLTVLQWVYEKSKLEGYTLEQINKLKSEIVLKYIFELFLKPISSSILSEDRIITSQSCESTAINQNVLNGTSTRKIKETIKQNDIGKLNEKTSNNVKGNGNGNEEENENENECSKITNDNSNEIYGNDTNTVNGNRDNKIVNSNSCNNTDNDNKYNKIVNSNNYNTDNDNRNDKIINDKNNMDSDNKNEIYDNKNNDNMIDSNSYFIFKNGFNDLIRRLYLKCKNIDSTHCDKYNLNHKNNVQMLYKTLCCGISSSIQCNATKKCKANSKYISTKSNIITVYTDNNDYKEIKTKELWLCCGIDGIRQILAECYDYNRYFKDDHNAYDKCCNIKNDTQYNGCNISKYSNSSDINDNIMRIASDSTISSNMCNNNIDNNINHTINIDNKICKIVKCLSDIRKCNIGINNIDNENFRLTRYKPNVITRSNLIRIYIQVNHWKFGSFATLTPLGFVWKWTDNIIMLYSDGNRARNLLHLSQDKQETIKYLQELIRKYIGSYSNDELDNLIVEDIFIMDCPTYVYNSVDSRTDEMNDIQFVSNNITIVSNGIAEREQPWMEGALISLENAMYRKYGISI